MNQEQTTVIASVSQVAKTDADKGNAVKQQKEALSYGKFRLAVFWLCSTATGMPSGSSIATPTNPYYRKAANLGLIRYDRVE
jgi:hypothetical protein